MKQFIKSKIRKLLHPAILRLGYKPDLPEPGNNRLEDLFLVLQQLHFQPKHIIDVGLLMLGPITVVGQDQR